MIEVGRVMLLLPTLSRWCSVLGSLYNYPQEYTLNKGHFGTRLFVPCREFPSFRGFKCITIGRRGLKSPGLSVPMS